MAVQAGIAIALSAPFWFREQLSQAARRSCARLISRRPDRDDDIDEAPPIDPVA
jgi:hypothetical protein